MDMKIAIIGAGAMGMLYGAKLKQSGNDVIMVDVVPAIIDKLNKDGIYLESENGKELIPIKARFAEDVTEDVDLAIMFTKCIYTEAAMRSAMGYLGKDTHVLTLQNGIGNVEIIKEFVPYENISAGVTMFTSDVIGTGHIRSYGGGNTKIMAVDGIESDALRNINKVLCNAGLESEIVPDVFVAIWEKVAFNAAVNATAAICGVTDGGLAATEEGKQLVFNVAKETVAVANSHEIAASEEKVINTIKKSFVIHKDHFPSMAQDVFNKRPTEAAFINGGIAKKAKEVNMPAPYNETLFALIRTIESGYKTQG